MPVQPCRRPRFQQPAGRVGDALDGQAEAAHQRLGRAGRREYARHAEQPHRRRVLGGHDLGDGAAQAAVDGVLLDPGSWRPEPAADVLTRLVAHVTPALDEAGDLVRTKELLADVVGRGSGARAQRSAGGLREAVALAVRRTLA